MCLKKVLDLVGTGECLEEMKGRGTCKSSVTDVFYSVIMYVYVYMCV